MAEAKENNDQKTEDKKEKKTLSIGGGKKTLSLGGAQSAKIRQQMEGGRASGGISVEVRRKRTVSEDKPVEKSAAQPPSDTKEQAALRNMTPAEREARAKMIREAIEAEEKRKAELQEKAKASEKKEEPTETPEEAARRQELEEIERIEAEEQSKVSEAELLRQKNLERMRTTQPLPPVPGRREEEDESVRERMKRGPKAPKSKDGDSRRRGGKITVTQVLNNDFERDSGRSLAAQRRAQAKARKAAMGTQAPAQKVYREVIVPEAITVQELANRMSERSADLIKSLMKMGVMATINQIIDADTAELIIDEFGHKIKRVSEADVEEGLEGIVDKQEDLQSRRRGWQT